MGFRLEGEVVAMNATSSFFIMRKVSRKQSRINRKLNNIKKMLAYNNPICRCCHRGYGTDLAHLLPRSLYPEYQTESWNLTLLCRGCHTKFDSDKKFRRKTGLGNHIKQVDKLAYNRYYE
ncbi:MAG: HNH endonuclease [Eubacteriales bacterium]|nr:HNH endonuclease [Eubacteriales bacterium]